MPTSFSIAHANFISYISTGGIWEAPRANALTLIGFLLLLDKYRRDAVIDFSSIESGESARLKALRNAINRSLNKTVMKSFSRLRFQLPPHDVGAILAPLKDLFEDFVLFGLVIQPPGDRAHLDDASGTAEEFFREIASEDRRDTLFLLSESREELGDVLDPSPALQELANQPNPPPATLLWSRSGAACSLPIDEAKEFYLKELADAKDRATVDAKLRSKAEAQARSKRLLHLSDFHFGDHSSDSARGYIKSHFRSFLEGIDRIVVTGDLINTPNPELLDEYFEFRNDVRGMTQHNLIVIPGNHDARPMGNAIAHLLRPTYQLVAEIDWRQIVVDDNMKCIFFCFNSNEGGSLARGRISSDQLRRMATAYQQECAQNKSKNLEAYFKIALIHHHPYRYVTTATALYDRILRWITRDEDAFTRLENADLFLEWCANRGISVILHGHKHVPHRIAATIRVNNVAHRLFVIGCGSTTGAEKSSLCYDVLSINPDRNRCAVTFYHDPSRSGSGFRVQQITIDLRS